MVAEDSYESRLPLAGLRILLDLGNEFGFDPSSSVELEEFFFRLVNSYHGPPAGLGDWLRPILTHTFRCLSHPPRWIQNPNWQMCGHVPMLFVGQVDVRACEGVLHDEASFYVFFDPASGECRTVMQIA